MCKIWGKASAPSIGPVNLPHISPDKGLAPFLPDFSWAYINMLKHFQAKHQAFLDFALLLTTYEQLGNSDDSSFNTIPNPWHSLLPTSTTMLDECHQHFLLVDQVSLWAASPFSPLPSKHVGALDTHQLYLSRKQITGNLLRSSQNWWEGTSELSRNPERLRSRHSNIMSLAGMLCCPCWTSTLL